MDQLTQEPFEIASTRVSCTIVQTWTHTLSFGANKQHGQRRGDMQWDSLIAASVLIYPPSLPFLPGPSRRSLKRCRCQMTQSCRQTQTADSGEKRVVPQDSYCKTAGICAGGGGIRRRLWGGRETECGCGIKKSQLGVAAVLVGWVVHFWNIASVPLGNDGNILHSQTQRGRCMVIMSRKECQICAWERSCDLRAAGIMVQNPTDPKEAHTPISNTYTHHILMVLHQAQIHPT